ncbi:hypothetical protein MRX96_023160 [Rhipicephalus microplus]
MGASDYRRSDSPWDAASLAASFMDELSLQLVDTGDLVEYASTREQHPGGHWRARAFAHAGCGRQAATKNCCSIGDTPRGKTGCVGSFSRELLRVVCHRGVGAPRAGMVRPTSPENARRET